MLEGDRYRAREREKENGLTNRKREWKMILGSNESGVEVNVETWAKTLRSYFLLFNIKILQYYMSL